MPLTNLYHDIMFESSYSVGFVPLPGEAIEGSPYGPEEYLPELATDEPLSPFDSPAPSPSVETPILAPQANGEAGPSVLRATRSTVLNSYMQMLARSTPTEINDTIPVSTRSPSPELPRIFEYDVATSSVVEEEAFQEVQEHIPYAPEIYIPSPPRLVEVLPEDDVTLYRPESPAEVPSPPTETVVDEFPSPTSSPDYSPVPVEARAIYGEQTLAGLLAEGLDSESGEEPVIEEGETT